MDRSVKCRKIALIVLVGVCAFVFSSSHHFVCAISFEFSEVPSVRYHTNPTFGSFYIAVKADPWELPMDISAFIVDVMVDSPHVTLGPVTIPATNALFSGGELNNFPPDPQTVRAVHAVATAVPMQDGNFLVDIPFEVAGGQVGQMNLSFGSFNALSDAMGGAIIPDTSSTGYINVTTIPFSPFIREWTVDQSGDWTVASNWSPEDVPNHDQLSALFGNAITADRNVNTTADVTVNNIQFANVNTYTVTGNGVIQVTAGTSSVRANLESLVGSHQFLTAMSLLSDTDVMVADGAELSLAGTLKMNGYTIRKLGAGTLFVHGNQSTGSGLLEVQAGRLAGDGHITGSVFHVGGTISPGGMLTNQATIQLAIPEPTAGALWLWGGMLVLTRRFHRPRFRTRMNDVKRACRTDISSLTAVLG